MFVYPTRIFCNIKWECFSGIENLNLFNLKLDVSVHPVGLDISFRSFINYTSNRDYKLILYILCYSNKRLVSRQYNALHGSGHVAEIEEDELPLIATHVYESLDSNGLPGLA